MAALLFPLCATAQIVIKDTGRELLLSEEGKPFLQYRYRAGDRGDGIPAQTGFIETLWGPYGNILTPNPASAAAKFSGVFWSWPRAIAGGETFGPGEEGGATRIFERWLEVSTAEELTTIGVQFAWVRNADDRAIFMETQGLEIRPADSRNRAIDLYLRLTNVFDGPVTITDVEGRAPLGLTVQLAETLGRIEAAASPIRPPVATGPAAPAWLDLSYGVPRSSRSAGIALFKHPFEPGGLQLRRASERSIFAALPSGAGHRLEPGEFLELRVRLYVHSDSGSGARLDFAGGKFASELEDSQP